jgi:uncharacterized protein (TIGR04255 family)
MYKKNFLDRVVIRVDFTKEIQELENSLPGQVVDGIVKIFPIPEPKIKHAKQYQLGPKMMAVKEIDQREWYYHGKDREKSLCIAKGCMFVEYFRYNETPEILTETFMAIIDLLVNSYKDLSFRRLGMRYIDKIEFNESDFTSWEKYIDRKLLSIFEIVDDKTKISRAFHNLELNYGDMNVKFQYGMHNPDYPAPIKRKIFILDTDVYLDSVQTRQEIESNLRKFHDKCVNLFEQSITVSLREVMNA